MASMNLSAIQSGTLLIAVATFFGAMIGALLNVGIHWYERRKRLQNVRRALLAELQTTDIVGYLNAKDTDVSDVEELLPLGSRGVYEEYLGEIGNLSAEEVHNIVLFYTGIENLELAATESKSIIEEGDEIASDIWARREEKGETGEEIQIRNAVSTIEEIQQEEHENIFATIEDLNEAKERAITEMQSHL